MLQSGWTARLQVPRARKVMLVTISPGGADPATLTPHLALQPNVIRVATDLGVHVTAGNGRVLPFWPYLKDWPEVRESLRLEDRQAEVAEITVTILGDSDIFTLLDAHGGGHTATARVDVWTDGITLENVIPRLAGRVTRVTDPRVGGPVVLTITDGDPDKLVAFPPGPLNRSHFPDAPNWVADVESRRVIIGPFPERIICHQIDTDRRVYYLCDPPATRRPTRLQKGGVELAGGWSVQDVLAPGAPGFRYTQIRLDAPAEDLGGGIGSEISVSGGTGMTDTNAIEFLANYGTFPMTLRAKAIARSLSVDFPLSVLIDAQSDVLSLLRDRLLPQTAYAFAFRRGQIDLIPLLAPSVGWRVGLGTGLLARLSDQPENSSGDSIYNAFQVNVGRDQYSTSTSGGQVPLLKILRDATHGPPDIQRICRQSEQLYGRRFLSVDANDLAVSLQPDFAPLSSRGGENLANALARIHALAHRRHAYLTDWLFGLSVELGDRILVTDADQNLSNEPCRVVEVVLAAGGPEITFQTEDA